jgi:predicted DsbA family dithiol-disulfide isomerase
MSEPPTIDVISDFVCPWCFIGTRRLESVLASTGTDAVVSVHPFLLDPTIPDEGVDLRERLERKFGRSAEPMFARVEAAARDAGIPLDFAKVRRYPSTLRAHALVARAAEKGTQRKLAGALFDAYFLEGKDIGDASVLAEIATAHGFEKGEALAIVRDADALARARQEAAEAAAQGISGVPFFVFGGRFAVSGAQPAAVFEQALGMLATSPA